MVNVCFTQEHDMDVYVCDDCKKNFDEKEELIEHLKKKCHKP